MNNGSKPSKLEINIETFPYFSSYYEKAGVCPVMRVNLSGLPKDSCARLEISIVGKCGDTEFIHRNDFVREAFCPDSYNYKQKDSCAFDYDSSSFSYNSLFLSSIEKEYDAEIYVMASFGSEKCCERTVVRLLPRNYWQGLEYEPSALGAFVLPYEEHIEEICSDIPEELHADYVKCDRKTLSEGITSIYKTLKERNIIYSRPAGYSAAGTQKIRLPEELFTGSSTLATPLEISLLFSSCAKHCGFDTDIIFGRGRTGEVQLLCGIWRKKSTVEVPVCENKEMLCDVIRYGELVVVEPSVFAAAQNTSFSLACESAQNMFLSPAFTLICAIDINKCFEYGVAPLLGKLYEDNNTVFNPKSAFSKLYTLLRRSPCMKMLSGEHIGRFPEIPLLCDFNDVFFNGDVFRKLLPIEYNINLTDFAGLDKNFSSVITSGREIKKYSANEKDAAIARLERLKSRIISKDSVMSVLREEHLYETASKMAFEKGTSNTYTVFGYIKVTDKLTETRSFAPICLAPTEIKYDNGSFYFRQSGTPIVNKLFIRKALQNASISYDSFIGAIMPTDKNEIFELFKNVRSALAETDDRYTYEIIREAHIIHLDISDFMLWSEMSVSGKRIIENECALTVLGKTAEPGNELDNEYVPAVISSGGVTNAIRATSNTVVTGAFAKDKKQVLCGIVKKEVTKGKTVLVACSNKSTLDYVNNALVDNNCSECMLVVDDKVATLSVAEETADLLDKYKNINQSNIADMPKDLAPCKAKLDDYENKLSRVHKLGMSVRGALKAYFDANCGMNDIPELEIDENLFQNADESALDALFSDAGRILTLASRLCKHSGLEPHTPLCNHPLYGTKPEMLQNDDDYERIHVLSEELCTVLSQYRDVFYDVSPILGIEINEIKTLTSLEKLNMLYELCLAAREIDIPDNFIGSDIEAYAGGINRVSALKRRCDEIVSELDFFQKEIFEDVETLLSGDKYEDSDKGLLKKFIHKKNNHETLLQYVSPENRIKLSSKPISDIYELLYEYKSHVIELRTSGDNEQVENSDYSLAEVATKAAQLIDEIAGENSFDRRRRLSNVFRLISLIPVDSSLARRITVVKAKLSEVLTDNDGCFKNLEKLLGVDFSSLCFDGGILSFDGMACYLKNVESKLFVSEKWLKWLSEADRIRKTLPSFVDFVEKHGVRADSDKLFAKSLLRPVLDRIVADTFEQGELESIGVAKDKYIELMLRASDLSGHNFVTAYTQSVRHCAETTSVQSLLEDAHMQLDEFWNKHKSLMSKVKPCVIAEMASLSGKQFSFDTVIILDSKDCGYNLLPAMVYGKRCVILDMSSDMAGIVTKNAVANGMNHIDTGKIFNGADSSLLPWLNSCVYGESLSLPVLSDAQKVELVRINGMYERAERLINKTEAELAVSKSVEAYEANKNANVVVTAFTNEQCTYIERLAYTMQKKSKLLAEAISDGRFSVVSVHNTYKKPCDCLIVSACFCQDKNGKFGWDFGNAQSGISGNASAAYTYLCESGAENVCFITSLNVRESHFLRRSCKNVWYFNSLCEFLSDGRIPVNTCDNDDLRENSVVAGLISSVGPDKSRVALCAGKYAFGSSLRSTDNELLVFADSDKDISIHDELYIKHIISKHKKTMSVSLASFSGEDGKKLISDFFVINSPQEV